MSRSNPSHRVSWLPKYLVSVLALAALGPYLVGSIRTEQFVVYGSVAILLPFALIRFQPQGGLVLLIPWVILVVVAMLGAIAPGIKPMPWDPGSALAGIDNLLLPLAIMLLVWSCVPATGATIVLNSYSRVVVWGAAVNGILAVISTRVDISSYLRVFWSGEAGVTTAENAADMGRFGGIFNQPAEAGVFYGVAGLLAVYCYSKQRAKLLLLLTLICFGGLICVSKVFIFGGVPLILVYLWRESSFSKMHSIFTVSTLIVGVAQSGLFQQWVGFSFLLRLLAPPKDSGLVEFYTSGRWNSGADGTKVISVVLSDSPIGGLGAAGLDVPYDSGWTESIVVAGIIGALCHAAVLLAIFYIAKREVDRNRRRLTLFLAVFLSGASLGISPLTANRAATIVWLLLGLLVLAQSESMKTKEVAKRDPVFRGVLWDSDRLVKQR